MSISPTPAATISGDAQRIAKLADQYRRTSLTEILGEPEGDIELAAREQVVAQHHTGNLWALDEAARVVHPWLADDRLDAVWADPAVEAAAELLGVPVPGTFVLPRCRCLGGLGDFPNPVGGLQLIGVAPLAIVA